MPEGPGRRLDAYASLGQRGHERPDLYLITRRSYRVARDAEDEKNGHYAEVRWHALVVVRKLEPSRDDHRTKSDEGDQGECPVKSARPWHGDHEQHRSCPQKEIRPERAGRERVPGVPGEEGDGECGTQPVQVRPHALRFL